MARSSSATGHAVVALILGAIAIAYLLPQLSRPAVEEGEPVDVPDPGDVFDPTEEPGVTIPRGYRRVVARDVIRPIYAPEYRSAAATDWAADTLVLGVAIDGDARAYPIRVLNFREMVIDRIGGTPILATW